jgi:hypothetical protein
MLELYLFYTTFLNNKTYRYVMKRKILLGLIIISTIFLSGCWSNTDVFIVPEPLNVNITGPRSVDGNSVIVDSNIFNHIKDGKMWGFSDVHNFASGGESVKYMGCTASNMSVKFVDFQVQTTEGSILIELYEDPINITDYGNLTGNGNLNRYLLYNATTKVYKNPTVDNDGTLLYTTIASATNQVGSLGSIPTEWVLKNGTCYIYKFTNQNEPDVNIYPVFLWYEDPLLS